MGSNTQKTKERISGMDRGINNQVAADEYFGYEDLEVWQKAVDWATAVINLVETINSSRKHFRLVEQLEASCTSVPTNIAEGKGRYSRREFVQYLYIARGSLYETVTLLEIFLRQGWINEEQFCSLKQEAQIIARMINALIRSIKEARGL